VGCKSPLTGGIKEANAGGQGAQVMGRLGYAAIVLEGKPEDDTLYKVVVNKDGVDIIADNSLKMLGNYDLIDKIKDEFGEKVACVSIGQAGEMKMTLSGLYRHGAAADPTCRPRRCRRRYGSQRG
jgi:aldehyde:ferredoxin oxidoreductase